MTLRRTVWHLAGLARNELGAAPVEAPAKASVTYYSAVERPAQVGERG